MNKNQGFLLIESVFEIFIVSLSMLIVIGTLSGTINILKSSLEEMVNLNLISNAVMEVIVIAKTEMINVTSYDSSTVLGNSSDGETVGFSYNNSTQKINRYKDSGWDKGSTLISGNITAFSYDGKFLKVTWNDEYELKLFIPFYLELQ
jgi:type II secretory pathway pseudopilin PulG